MDGAFPLIQWSARERRCYFAKFGDMLDWESQVELYNEEHERVFGGII